MAFLILILLLLFNAVFAMSELAIISSRRVRLEKRAAEGHAGAAAALALAASPTKFLSTVQVGMTLTGILSGALGEAALADDLAETLRGAGLFAPYARPIATGIVVALLTYVTLVLAELVPKRIGMHWAEPIAGVIAAPMMWISRAAAPIVWVLTTSTDVVARVFGVRGEREDEVSEAEVQHMVAKGAEAGVFHEAQQELVERVFRFADMRVKALMVPRSEIVWIDAKETSQHVRLVVATNPFSHFLVCDGNLDKLVGIVHVKDLVKYGLVAGGEFAVAELARPAMFVPAAGTAVKLLERFRETGNHVAVVVDEFGGTEGLVTLNDIVGAIIGDLGKLRVNEEPAAVRRADGSWSIDGRMPLAEFCATIEAPAAGFDDYASVDTVGGLVFALAGKIPKIGDAFTIAGFRIEVIDMDARRVDRLVVTRLPAEAGDGDSKKEDGA